MDGLEDMVVMGRLHHVMHRVVLVADAAEHEAANTFMERDFIMSVGIGNGAFVDDFPIHVHAGQRGTLAVFCLFVNGTFDVALGKGACGEGQ